MQAPNFLTALNRASPKSKFLLTGESFWTLQALLVAICGRHVFSLKSWQEVKQALDAHDAKQKNVTAVLDPAHEESILMLVSNNIVCLHQIRKTRHCARVCVRACVRVCNADQLTIMT